MCRENEMLGRNPASSRSTGSGSLVGISLPMPPPRSPRATFPDVIYIRGGAVAAHIDRQAEYASRRCSPFCAQSTFCWERTTRRRSTRLRASIIAPGEHQTFLHENNETPLPVLLSSTKLNAVKLTATSPTRGTITLIGWLVLQTWLGCHFNRRGTCPCPVPSLGNVTRPAVPKRPHFVTACYSYHIIPMNDKNRKFWKNGCVYYAKSNFTQLW